MSTQRSSKIQALTYDSGVDRRFRFVLAPIIGGLGISFFVLGWCLLQRRQYQPVAIAKVPPQALRKLVFSKENVGPAVRVFSEFPSASELKVLRSQRQTPTPDAFSEKWYIEFERNGCWTLCGTLLRNNYNIFPDSSPFRIFDITVQKDFVGILYKENSNLVYSSYILPERGSDPLTPRGGVGFYGLQTIAQDSYLTGGGKIIDQASFLWDEARGLCVEVIERDIATNSATMTMPRGKESERILHHVVSLKDQGSEESNGKNQMGHY